LFVPVFGLVFYLTFGINYWKKKYYGKKFKQGIEILKDLKVEVREFEMTVIANKNKSVNQFSELTHLIDKDLGSPLTTNNQVKLLINGEQKFPELIAELHTAKHHIHLEYYIFEYDTIGTEIIELLIAKAKQGVEVRFIYDDFGSPTIKRKTEVRMRNAGVQVFPFQKVRFYFLANRINYRNHRKIVVIDGHTAFVGGINVSDRYINNKKNKLFWRDTHIKIQGPGVYYLQYLFITDWNFCGEQILKPNISYFPTNTVKEESTYVQIAAGGPDSMFASIQYSILQAIFLAKKEILITTPYFIPGDGIIDALCVAALSGLSVKLLVPGISDSKLVNAASRSNYISLLLSGVEIYTYQKGFVHAKTMVTDELLSIVGTANMDVRSFDLNFEVNALIYDQKIATTMRTQFFEDLKFADKLDYGMWSKRSFLQQLPERVARLFSPVL
jgi:cardiolipin synthase